jgi:hypothetical protein
MSEETKIDSVNFNGEQYLLESLTPRVMDSLNVLIKLQGAIAELAIDLKVKQSAQIHISDEVKKFIEEDKIEPNPKQEDENV